MCFNVMYRNRNIERVVVCRDIWRRKIRSWKRFPTRERFPSNWHKTRGARARHVVCHPVDRKPQGGQEEDEEEGRSRKKPDANKSTAVRARGNGSDKEKRERKRERERVKEGFRLQYDSQASSGDGNKSEVMIFKRQRRCRAPER